MQSLRRAVVQPGNAQSYVCWSCRLNAFSRGHTSAFTEEASGTQPRSVRTQAVGSDVLLNIATDFVNKTVGLHRVHPHRMVKWIRTRFGLSGDAIPSTLIMARMLQLKFADQDFAALNKPEIVLDQRKRGGKRVTRCSAFEEEKYFTQLESLPNGDACFRLQQDHMGGILQGRQVQLTIQMLNICDEALPPSIVHRAVGQRHSRATEQAHAFRLLINPKISHRGRPRFYHTSPRRQTEAATAAVISPPPPDFLALNPKQPENPRGIRAQLRQWQELNGDREIMNDKVDIDSDPDNFGLQNDLTRLPQDSAALNNFKEENDEEREAMARFMEQSKSGELSGDVEARVDFLQMGDLVELDYIGSQRLSVVGVFVRRIGGAAQFFSMHGRWHHFMETSVQYSIPGWVRPELVQPLLDYLPSSQLAADLAADDEDLSVPRNITAPLVSKLVEFHNEVQEIYRRHASALDSAHDSLAHDTDLRYGSLTSAATMLLKTPADKLSVAALFAVRKSLLHSGFGFNIDRRSHRLTGYLQIRSKDQVRVIESVRISLREWQDDLAARATMSDNQLRKHRHTKRADNVYRFLEKAKQIINRSRKNRDPTMLGNVGPSKIKLPITPSQDSVRVAVEYQFEPQDEDLLKFIEAWSLVGMFDELPQFEALPPLLLQATGLYEGHQLLRQTGLLFLQELGTITPYENRVRFDQHLLLPSSQHSKPLQNLMASLLSMSEEKHTFTDSMADLRHDWGALPVYCIDDANAHEIDDGISLQQIGINRQTGQEEYWVHIHIANPTAFFSREHPLAKMARHMGESVYMPERTYMMIPRWATQRHFSLQNDRPCITFSAKMNSEGQVLESNIRCGTIRNVLRLTPKDVSKLLGTDTKTQRKELVLTVGGEPPTPRPRKSALGDVTSSQIQELEILCRLAQKRLDLRLGSGGLNFDSQRVDTQVWQNHRAPGLAWDHPHRKGARFIEGDPVIQMRTAGLINWFAPQFDDVVMLVREMMLLACEVAGKWCVERQVPAIFRGTVQRPDSMRSEDYFREILTPAMQQSESGVYPMYLGMRYMQTFGSTKLRTTPFRHQVLGMDYYGKVTSPLRRYGDMILHWQIQAALREEATTGRSLVTHDLNADRRFLPFSANVLETIIVGLQPRERIVTSAKLFATRFWAAMLLFRAYHFDEADVPRTLHAYVQDTLGGGWSQGKDVYSICVELNMFGAMRNPERTGLQPARQGDTWECRFEMVDMWKHRLILIPVRLVERSIE